MKRFYVIDALRAVLALCVAVGHAEMFPLFGLVGQSTDTFDLLARGWRTIVFGPPAVIVFFVISGFCIHLPFASTDRPVPLIRFYARRYLRILVPLIAVVVIYKAAWPQSVVAGKNSILWHSTLWSIVCEEIYYAVYPLLNRLRRLCGWPPLIIVAFILAAIVGLSFPLAKGWEDLGIIFTTVVLAPTWLLGCHLAETVSSMKGEPRSNSIWIWRAGVWGVMWVAGALHFHGGIYQTQTAMFVGIAAYFWLRAELSHEQDRAPWTLLVWAGGWSYSLYLIHPVVIGLMPMYKTADSSRLAWIFVFLSVLIASYVFYLLIERPSHKLARKVSLFEASKARSRVI